MELDKEYATYCRELPRLLEGHEGEFVLIHGETVDSFWKTENEGYEAGRERFGLEPFMVKQVLRTESDFFNNIDVIP